MIPTNTTSTGYRVGLDACNSCRRDYVAVTRCETSPISSAANYDSTPTSQRLMLAQTTAPAELYATARWYACRTRSRAEKQVDRLLAGHGFESFLPLIEKERQWADRKKRVKFPLFPGYTFTRFTLRDLQAVLRTPGLASVVQTNGHPTPLDDQEIESVRLFVAGVNETGQLPTPEYEFEIGQDVVVAEGPFAGMCGVLVQQRGRTKGPGEILHAYTLHVRDACLEGFLGKSTGAPEVDTDPETGPFPDMSDKPDEVVDPPGPPPPRDAEEIIEL